MKLATERPRLHLTLELSKTSTNPARRRFRDELSSRRRRHSLVGAGQEKRCRLGGNALVEKSQHLLALPDQGVEMSRFGVEEVSDPLLQRQTRQLHDVVEYEALGDTLLSGNADHGALTTPQERARGNQIVREPTVEVGSGSENVQFCGATTKAIDKTSHDDGTICLEGGRDLGDEDVSLSETRVARLDLRLPPSTGNVETLTRPDGLEGQECHRIIGRRS
jgi:hypothetical protein